MTLGIVSCDTCNKTDPPTYNKTNVVFQFPQGSLAKAAAGEVEDTIGQLLAISEDSQQQDQGGSRATINRAAEQQGGQDQPAAQPAQQTETTNDRIGHDYGQVEAVIGQAGQDSEPGGKADLRLQGLEDHVQGWEGFGRSIVDVQ